MSPASRSPLRLDGEEADAASFLEIMTLVPSTATLSLLSTEDDGAGEVPDSLVALLFARSRSGVS